MRPTSPGRLIVAAALCATPALLAGACAGGSGYCDPQVLDCPPEAASDDEEAPWLFTPGPPVAPPEALDQGGTGTIRVHWSHSADGRMTHEARQVNHAYIEAFEIIDGGRVYFGGTAADLVPHEGGQVDTQTVLPGTYTVTVSVSDYWGEVDGTWVARATGVRVGPDQVVHTPLMVLQRMPAAITVGWEARPLPLPCTDDVATVHVDLLLGAGDAQTVWKRQTVSCNHAVIAPYDGSVHQGVRFDGLFADDTWVVRFEGRDAAGVVTISEERGYTLDTSEQAFVSFDLGRAGFE